MKVEEIVATKLKCLLQRQHAPDLFDYVHSVRLLGGSLNRAELVTTFLRKTIFGRNPNVAKEILTKTPFDFFRKYWDKGIVCAKNVRIGVEEAVKFLVDDLADLFQKFPTGHFPSRVYFSAEQRLPIMEAGRELSCLRIVYDGVSRIVEPYALKYMQRRDGVEREYFYVFDRTGGRHSGPGIKSLVAEKLTSVENTSEKFEPQFIVELAKQGEVPKDRYLFDPNKPAKASSRSAVGYDGPRYVYQCTFCGRRFEREQMNSSLRAHKIKNGSLECPGRIGFYVDTKY